MADSIMDSLIYSLNATVPVFVVIVVGYLLKRIGWINQGFIEASNKINFKVTLPALLIQDMVNNNFMEKFELGYVIFCAVATTISILTMWFLARIFMKDKSIIGEFVQASYRSSAAVLGAAFILNIYSDTGMVPLMIIGAVPLYNIFAVIILTVECPEKGAGQSKTLSSTLKGIATNPIILSIVAGVVLSVLNVHFPKMLDNTISNFSKMATPLALIAIGGSFEFGKALQKIKPAVIATAMKLVGWALVFLPIAIWLGYRDAKLMAIVIMLASPVTPSCYIMSRSMHSEGTLTSSVIVLTTMCSAFTITAIIYILRAMGLV